jgi:hypothetical protein
MLHPYVITNPHFFFGSTTAGSGELARFPLDWVLLCFFRWHFARMRRSSSSGADSLFLVVLTGSSGSSSITTDVVGLVKKTCP